MITHQSLSPEEGLVANIFLGQVYNRVVRQKYINDAAFGLPFPNTFARSDLGVLVSFPIGRRYWEMNSAGRDPEITALGEELLASQPVGACGR